MAIEQNSVVSMHYELKDAQTGEVLDSSLDAAPISFILGTGQIIAGLESELLKLSLNEKADINVAAAEGYGEYDESALQTLPKEQFAGIELTEGMTLYGQGENGQSVQVVVKSFDDNNVEIDFNHPLAGKDLLFAVEIMEVREATPEELSSGVVGGMGGSCGCGHSHGSCDDHSQGDSCCSTDGGGSCCGSH